ncbi:uncharacterized protein LOC143861332 [Tasmannia lanceolata]|uniref:uncharacterized protein LOC143861332 n=1 Tax=Tasmannia lanceolata TaxID=3420 RepID=UPI0040631B07
MAWSLQWVKALFFQAIFVPSLTKIATKHSITNFVIHLLLANTVVPSISMQFGRFETAKVWDFLSRRYVQSDFAQKYKLEQDLRLLKHLKGQSISEFHSQMNLIWDELALMEPKWMVDAELWYNYREEIRLVQFLMALQDDFETIHATILHRSPLPTVDSALSELLAEETLKGLLPDPAAVFAVPSRPRNNYSKGKSSQGYPNMSKIQCIYCKEYGHMVKNFPSPTSNNIRN